MANIEQEYVISDWRWN